LAVAQGAVAAQLLGDVFGDSQGFGVAGDDFCSHGVFSGALGPLRAPIAGKPAPTGPALSSRLVLSLWELACRRLGCKAAPRALKSDPGMPRRQGAVEVVRANRVVLPAHRVMQGVHPRIAPVAVEVE